MLALLALVRRVVHRRPVLLPALLVPVVLVGSATLALLVGSGAPPVGSAPASAAAPAAAAPPGVSSGTATATVTCTPGWTIYPNPAPAGDSVLNAVTAIGGNAHDLWAVGVYTATGSYTSTTLTLHGDGTNWTYIPSPNPPASSKAVLSGVAGVAANDVWAVGCYGPSCGLTLTEHWDGTAWTIVPSPNGFNNSHLYAVAAIASDDVWTVGMANSTFHPASVAGLTEHWNGTSWSIVPIPAGSGTPLYGVAAVSANDVWAVGGGYPAQPAYGRAYIVHWNGSAWSTVANPANTGSALQAVTVVSGNANDVWAVGYTGGLGTGQTLIEHWDGAAWAVVPSPNPGATTNLLYGVSARAPNDVWAVGDTNQASGGVKTFALHWDGSGWFQVPTPDDPAGRGYFYGVATPAGVGGAVWAVGTTGCLTGCTQNALIARAAPACLTPVPTLTPTATSTPAPTCGLSWRGVSNPDLPGGGRLFGVAPVTARAIWPVGVYFPNNDMQALTEHGDGTSWSVMPADRNSGTASGLRAVAAVAANDVWAVGSGGGTITLHWDGSRWTRVSSPSPGDVHPLNAVAAVAATDVWAVGWQQTNNVASALIEHWNGTQWSVVSSPRQSTRDVLNGVAAVAANDIWAVGTTAPNNYAQPLTEHWDGTRWSIVPSPGLGSLQSVAPVAANDVWAVGCRTHSCNTIGAQTLIEHWNGATWSIVPSPNPGAGNNELYGVAGVAPGDIWAVGTSYADGGPYHTLIEHWNGASWSVMPSPPSGSLLGVAARAANNLWAVGDLGNYSGGLVLHYDDPCVGTATATPTATRTAGAGNTPTRTSTPLPPTAGASNTPAYTRTPLPPPATPTVTIAPPTGTVAPPSATTARTQTPGGPTATTVPSATRTPVRPTSTSAPSSSPGPSATPCTVTFSDVHPSDYFYQPVLYLYCHGAISGYADGTFRPYNDTTRAQMVKIVVLGFQQPIATPTGGQYTFHDVPPGAPFFAVIETAAADGIISGYSCGGPDEPCDAQQRPYFRPNANVTRGQLAKIDVVAAGWPLLNPPRPTFIDVLPASAFYQFVETAVCHGVVSGYADSTFRPGNNATRGQIAKIVYLSLTAGGSCP